jgi:hypothetical protein
MQAFGSEYGHRSGLAPPQPCPGVACQLSTLLALLPTQFSIQRMQYTVSGCLPFVRQSSYLRGHLVGLIRLYPLDGPSWFEAGAEDQSYLLLQVRFCETNEDVAASFIRQEFQSYASVMARRSFSGDTACRVDAWSNVVD